MPADARCMGGCIVFVVVVKGGLPHAGAAVITVNSDFAGCVFAVCVQTDREWIVSKNGCVK